METMPDTANWMLQVGKHTFLTDNGVSIYYKESWYSVLELCSFAQRHLDTHSEAFYDLLQEITDDVTNQCRKEPTNNSTSEQQNDERNRRFLWRTQLYNGENNDIQQLSGTMQSIVDYCTARIRTISHLDFNFSPVSKEKPLFLIGKHSEEQFLYTVESHDGKRKSNLSYSRTSLDDLAQKLDGAVYVVERLPRIFAKNEVNSLLAREYRDIKKTIHTQGLEHYPILLPDVN